MSFFAYMNKNILAISFNPINRINSNKPEFALIFHHKPVKVWFSFQLFYQCSQLLVESRLIFQGYLVARPVSERVPACFIKRFQKIVQGIDFKCRIAY